MSQLTTAVGHADRLRLVDLAVLDDVDVTLLGVALLGCRAD
ncbi:hypothetical protein [Streptomyces sp. CFMR 7]|nr:hypothetical protein [Streptomyces sp. CFMR 7]